MAGGDAVARGGHVDLHAVRSLNVGGVADGGPLVDPEREVVVRGLGALQERRELVPVVGHDLLGEVELQDPGENAVNALTSSAITNRWSSRGGAIPTRSSGRGGGFGADVLDIGEPLDTGQLIQPRSEPEIVFVLGRDLAGPQVSAADVLAASSGVAVGIEVLDSRYRDYRFTMAVVVADSTPAGASSSARRSRPPASPCAWPAWC